MVLLCTSGDGGGLSAAKYRQFAVIGEDPSQTVKDSIHLDWSRLKAHCAECGVTVKMWDGFAHRLLWQKTWPRAVAFQPLSTRYETERPDSPIEGFVFRLWQWQPDQVADTFTAARQRRHQKVRHRQGRWHWPRNHVDPDEARTY